MKTITVFLASSNELNNDRNSFQALIAKLDDIYEPRGIRIKCRRWERSEEHTSELQSRI